MAQNLRFCLQGTAFAAKLHSCWIDIVPITDMKLSRLHDT